MNFVLLLLLLLGWLFCLDSFAKVSCLSSFLYFYGQNEYEIRVSVHCSIYTKKLINIKFGLKVYFFGQNRLKYQKWVSNARAYQYWSLWV